MLSCDKGSSSLWPGELKLNIYNNNNWNVINRNNIIVQNCSTYIYIYHISCQPSEQFISRQTHKIKYSGSSGEIGIAMNPEKAHTDCYTTLNAFITSNNAW